ncbi:ubiquitin-2 like Rad60 SUMO-like-domain-containing protein [Syncephalastrum racemosum]|uniref:Ubiquitin-2 like Rad60 SUMO-like-domain-containing protein n=1 Tax=Syncephalastrum racemosum TaxID=13706 RepID=A0A1X2H9D0_SYNRA|nr:ubiquitin-2 like Rad60 SUMO-like-domain-containing protein [Syncephalastrum racemosum]
MTSNGQEAGTSGVHMTEISQDPRITTTAMSSSVPLSVSSSVERSTLPTTTDNGSAVAIRSTSSAAAPSDTSDIHLPSHEENFESEQEEDEDEDVKVPLDKVRLTFLLISGLRHSETFDPSTPIIQVKKYIWSHWPQEWTQTRPAPESVARLELLYLGKFLDNDASLNDKGLLGGQSSTVHLLVRDQQSKKSDNSKSPESATSCKCCIIL